MILIVRLQLRYSQTLTFSPRLLKIFGNPFFPIFPLYIILQIEISILKWCICVCNIYISGSSKCLYGHNIHCLFLHFLISKIIGKKTEVQSVSILYVIPDLDPVRSVSISHLLILYLQTGSKPLQS